MFKLDLAEFESMKAEYASQPTGCRSLTPVITSQNTTYFQGNTTRVVLYSEVTSTRNRPDGLHVAAVLFTDANLVHHRGAIG